jgi:hypothetical protein
MSFMSRPLLSWQGYAMYPKRVPESFKVRGGVGGGWRLLFIIPNGHGVCQCAATKQMQAEAPLILYGLLVEPASQPEVLLPALDGCGRKALPGLPRKVSINGVLLIPTLSLRATLLRVSTTHAFVSANSRENLYVKRWRRRSIAWHATKVALSPPR